MDISVVVKGREDETRPDEVIGLASVADDLGYDEIWVGEGPAWDAFVLATAVGFGTRSASLTVGPVPVSVRDPATVARGAASVAAATGRTVGVALGTASIRVVERLHGRSRARSVRDLRESARSIRELIDAPSECRWPDDPDRYLLRRLGVPTGPLTVAAFGDRAIEVAAAYADRMVVDLVTPEQVATLRAKLDAAVESERRVRMAAWLPAAVEPTDEGRSRVEESIAGYLTVAGYSEMFLGAGFGVAVDAAGSGAPIRELAALLPDEASGLVGLVGTISEIATRLRMYEDAGLDEVALVPVTTGDAGGERTLQSMRALAS